MVKTPSKLSKIPILSLKGGVGKTTTCLGIAKALKGKGYKVGLLDIDIHASALPRALGLELSPGYEPLIGGKLRPVRTVEGYELYSIGLLFPESSANMWDGEQKASAVKQIVTSSIAWDPDLDFIVVDTPPTSGDEVQSLLKNMANIFGAIIVCQPNDLSILGITKTLDVMRETGASISGIVANMVGFRCPKCGEISNPFDRKTENIEEIARKFKVPYLGAIPFSHGDEMGKVFADIVDKYLATKPVVLKKEEEGGLSRWVAKILLK